MARDPQVSNRRHRIEVRVSVEQDALIRQAADLEHESVTTFVLKTVTGRAQSVLEVRNTVTLANDAFDRFYATLDDAAAVVPELVELFQADPLPRG